MSEASEAVKQKLETMSICEFAQYVSEMPIVHLGEFYQAYLTGDDADMGRIVREGIRRAVQTDIERRLRDHYVSPIKSQVSSVESV